MMEASGEPFPFRRTGNTISALAFKKTMISITPLEITLSEDRLSAKITGAKSCDPATVFSVLVAVNVRDFLRQSKSAAWTKHYYKCCQADGELRGLSEAAVINKFKNLRRNQPSSVEASINFVWDDACENIKLIECPDDQSFEQAVRRDLKKELALETAHDGIVYLPTEEEVEEEMRRAGQPEARALACEIISRALLK